MSAVVASLFIIATQVDVTGADLNSPQIILDLSPIARLNGQHEDRALWTRVEQVIAAWREQKDATATFIGVADKSLYKYLDSSGKITLKKWEQSELAMVVGFADQKILELAEKYPDARVITSDLFRAERRDNPWLNYSDRIYKPTFSGGQVTFSIQVLTPLTPHLESRFIEDREINYRKLKTPEAERALQWEWACINPGCELSQKQCFESLPAYFEGVIKCPKCYQVAKQLGSCANTRELVIQITGVEVQRVSLPEGMHLQIGRGRGVDQFDVRPLMDEKYFRLVSRMHLMLTNRGGRIFAKDLKSSNGTNLVRNDGAIRKVLLPDVEQLIELSDSILMAGDVLSLRISGKKRARGKYDPKLNLPQLPNNYGKYMET